MTRILAAFIAASGLMSGANPASASDWTLAEPSSGFAPAPLQDSARWAAAFWPRIAHAPAISKTFSANPNHAIPSEPAPSYDYQWQNQPSPPAPILAPPQFSHPKQGYFPREQIAPQVAPGYEYDFGGAGTFPPLYPIEGANWKAPRSHSRSAIINTAQTTVLDANGYAHCPL